MLPTARKVSIRFWQFVGWQSALLFVLAIDMLLMGILLFVSFAPSFTGYLHEQIVIVAVSSIAVLITVYNFVDTIKEWKILHRGFISEVKIVNLDNDDQNEERYHIEYYDINNNKFTGSFVNHSRITTKSRTFLPRYKSGDIVHIVIDPDNPRNFVQWTSKYETA